MKEVLDIIDSAIRRLVTPVAMLVAAALVSQGLQNEGSSPITIYTIMALLIIWAIVFALMSLKEALDAVKETNVGQIRKVFIGASLTMAYFILFFVALKLGMDKISI